MSPTRIKQYIDRFFFPLLSGKYWAASTRFSGDDRADSSFLDRESSVVDDRTIELLSVQCIFRDSRGAIYISTITQEGVQCAAQEIVENG